MRHTREINNKRLTSILLTLVLLISITPTKVQAKESKRDYDNLCLVVINEREESIIYDSEDLYLIASVVYSEANTESDLGKRLVIDVILNRIDSEKFPNDLEGVITQDSQFTREKDLSSKDSEIVSNLIELSIEEICNRTDSHVIFFRRDSYHERTTPIIKEGDHYFSGYRVN